MEKILSILPPVAGVLALAAAAAITVWIMRQDTGNDRMREISGYIHSGAMAFLKREYITMATVIVLLAVVIGVSISPITAALYVFGALFSVLAGYFGITCAPPPPRRTAV